MFIRGCVNKTGHIRIAGPIILVVYIVDTVLTLRATKCCLIAFCGLLRTAMAPPNELGSLIMTGQGAGGDRETLPRCFWKAVRWGFPATASPDDIDGGPILRGIQVFLPPKRISRHRAASRSSGYDHKPHEFTHCRLEKRAGHFLGK